MGTAAVVAGTLFTTVSVAPAHAYSPDPKWAVKTGETDSCNPCVVTDPIDNSYFKWDVGGEYRKIELRHPSNGTYLGKVEFHPLDEKLWVYDTANDGDTFYVKIDYWDGKWYHLGPYSAGGTSDLIDKRVYDLNIREGTRIDIVVYDDRSMNDEITGPWRARA